MINIITTAIILGLLFMLSNVIFKKKNHSDIFTNSSYGFGYKNQWLAIKSTDHEKVAEALKLKKIKKIGWQKGVEEGYAGKVFVTSPIDGWVLVLGIDIYDTKSEKTQSILKNLSTEFGESQLYLTNRIVEFHGWALAKNGNIIKSYSYVGESNEILDNYGEPTKTESKLKIAQTPEQLDDENFKTPNEETVMKIAEEWSINPSELDNRTGLAEHGLIGNF